MKSILNMEFHIGFVRGRNVICFQFHVTLITKIFLHYKTNYIFFSLARLVCEEECGKEKAALIRP